MNIYHPDRSLPPRRGMPGSVWVLIVLLLGLGGICVILRPSLANGGPTTRGTCASNLKSIATACLVYAEGQQGQLPPSLNVLLEGGAKACLQPKQLVCPKDKRAYIYIPGQTNRMDPRNVVVYEPLENHNGEGGNLGYLDGHAAWQRPKAWRDDLQATRDRIRIASRPSWSTEPN